MSRVRKISVRGVRNFSDDTEEIAYFPRPLSLILGPNGCGKTTIIEALKYAITGDFPPGSNSGKSFIHDPAIKNTQMVRGVVKVEVVDRNGELCTVSRTIECSHKGKTSKFKTLDNTLTRQKDKDHEPVMITNRCADIDAEVVSAMGVPKAILNYVIFCHQEESSWPLEEGKKLKERFDQIFDTAHYNKALESMRKQAKLLEAEAKLVAERKKTNEYVLKEARQKQSKLNEHMANKEALDQKLSEIEDKLKPLREKLKKIEEIEQNFRQLTSKKEKKLVELSSVKEQIAQLKDHVKIFEGTLEELQQEMAKFERGVQTDKNQIAQQEKRLQQFAKEEENITNSLSDQKVQVGTLKQQQQENQVRIGNRNKVMNEILSMWDMPTSLNTSISEADVLKKRDEMEERLNEMSLDLTCKISEYEDEEKNLQKELDSVRDEKSRIDSEMLMLNKEMVTTREEISRVRSQLSEVGAGQRKLEKKEKELSAADDKIKNLSNSCDIKKQEANIEKEQSAIEELEISLAAVDQELSALHQQSSLQAELELIRSYKEAKQVDLNSLKSKHESSIKQLLHVSSLKNVKIKAKLQDAEANLMRELENFDRKIKDSQQQSMSYQTSVDHEENEVRKKIAEVESNKKRVEMVCDDMDYEEALKLQSKKVKDLQDKRGMYAYQSIMYEKYIAQMREKDPCCPLCQRNFENARQANKLIGDLKRDIESHPERLESCENDLKKCQRKYESMLEIKPVFEKIAHIEKFELKKMRENIKDLNKKLKASEEKLKTLQMEKKVPVEKLALCKNVMGEITLWDKYVDEIEEFDEKISDLTSKSGSTSNKTVKEVQKEKEDLQRSFKEKRQSLEEFQKNLSLFKEKLQRARETRNTVHEEVLKIRNGMQLEKQLMDKKNELMEKESKFDDTLQGLRKKLSRAEDNLAEATRNFNQAKAEHSKLTEASRSQVLNAQSKFNDFVRIQSEVTNFAKRKIDETLAKLEKRIEDLQTNLQKCKGNKANVEAEIGKMKEAASRQEMRKRQLIDNISLRQKQDKEKELRKEFAAIETEIKSLNHDSVITEYNRVKNRENLMIQEKNVAAGKIGQILESIKDLEKELSKEEYRMAQENFIRKCAEHKTLIETVKNLKECAGVIDKAMIYYHEERMSTVNKIMERLWGRVYNGRDTTTIQIRTEATEGVGSSKRSYNYRLIQKKHGVEMEMKGRCSAGQKILASLIIRMALAETFCKNCGVLALDEPTTNLDEANADNLAEAISAIVKLRSSSQKHFQLIVISHDEKFLMKLGNLSANSKGFFELYRYPTGFSGIRYRRMGLKNDNKNLHDIPSDLDDEEEQPSSKAIVKDSLDIDEEPGPSNGRKRPPLSDDTDSGPSTKRQRTRGKDAQKKEHVLEI